VEVLIDFLAAFFGVLADRYFQFARPRPPDEEGPGCECRGPTLSTLPINGDQASGDQTDARFGAVRTWVA
jgi:hypothetical protein